MIPYNLGQMYDLSDILQIVVSLPVNQVDWETQFQKSHPLIRYIDTMGIVGEEETFPF